jgi:oligopeptide/dipeptide ABC transporter ATP-binding protein
MGVVRRFAQRVIVVYAGRMVEEGPIDQILGAPEHPYTQGLLAAIPGVNPRKLLPTIPGTLQSLVGETAGCLFEPRCHLGGGNAICRSDIPIDEEIVPGHRVACHLARAARNPAEAGRTKIERPET